MNTLHTRCSYVSWSPFMIVPEFPVSDRGHTFATHAILPASASQNSTLIQHIIGTPSSLLIDKQIPAVLVDINRGSVVTLPSRGILSKILRPLGNNSGRGLKCDGPRTTGPWVYKNCMIYGSGFWFTNSIISWLQEGFFTCTYLWICFLEKKSKKWDSLRYPHFSLFYILHLFNCIIQNQKKCCCSLCPQHIECHLILFGNN